MNKIELVYTFTALLQGNKTHDLISKDKDVVNVLD